MQLLNIGFNSNHVFTNFNFESLHNIKYASGITAHNICATAVAKAAHKIHISNIYIRIKSNIIFIIPIIMDTFNHKSGLSFTMKKLWNTCCSMQNVIDKNNTLQYIIQFDKTSHDAFNDIIIGLIKKNHSIENIIPHIIKKYTNIEKYFLANGRFFSQRVFEINALHQLPIINQMEAIINNTGTVKFTAVKASFHT
jgi:hypothetical protein